MKVNWNECYLVPPEPSDPKEWEDELPDYDNPDPPESEEEEKNYLKF